MTRATRVVLFKKVKSVGEVGLDKLSASDESVLGVHRSQQKFKAAGGSRKDLAGPARVGGSGGVGAAEDGGCSAPPRHALQDG